MPPAGIIGTLALDIPTTQNMSFNISKILAPGQLEKLVPFAPPEPFNVGEKELQMSVDELLEQRLFQLAAEKVAGQLTEMGTDIKSTAVSLEVAQKAFSLWETRLTCLVLANFHRVAHTEAKSLGDLNVDLYRESADTNTPPKPDISIHWERKSIVPWSLRVLTVRLASGSDTHGAILKYHSLAREAKIMRAEAKTEEDKKEWAQRLVELGIYVTAVLVGMGDYSNAISHVTSMVHTEGTVELPRHQEYLEYLLCILNLQTGNSEAAKEVLDASKGDFSTLSAICLMAVDDFDGAGELLSDDSTKDALVQNTEAIASFSTGDTEQSIVQFQNLLDKHADKMSPAALSASIFNVCSLYETRVDGGVLKRSLMDKLRAGGVVGIDVTAFKLQAA